jgi:uncharacterized protein YutE (UPF0331/DUF86 family)
MIAASVLSAKLADIAERLTMVRKHRQAMPADYRTEPEARDLVAFNLMLAVQSAADLATHVVADEGFTAARTVAEAFARLAEHGIIDAALALRLQGAVAFRNRVAHGYVGPNLDMLHEAAQSGVDDLEQFSRVLATWATGARP